MESTQEHEALPSGYIYLLIEREFIKTGESVYKIGMTAQENHIRFNQYPKGSRLLFQVICNNCSQLENKLIQKFKTLFTHRKDYGREYFEGNYKIMIHCMYEEYTQTCGIYLPYVTNNIAATTPELFVSSTPSDLDSYNNEDEYKDNTKDEDIAKVEDMVDEYKDNTYFVTTCDEWMENNGIETILITDKKGKGYLKYKNAILRTLHDNTKPDFNAEDCEDLMGFIKHNAHYSPGKYTENNNDAIFKDVIRTKLGDPPVFHNLLHHEHIVIKEEGHSRHDKYILDCKMYSITPISEFEKQHGFILPGFSSSPLVCRENINTDIVTTILDTLVSKETQTAYKQMLHNLFVDPCVNIVFYDENSRANSVFFGMLTSWTHGILSHLTHHEKNDVDSETYYENPRYYNTLIKKKKIKCVYIRELKTHTIESQIKLFQSKQIKTILVHRHQPFNPRGRPPMYTRTQYEQYLKDNWTTIVETTHISNECKYDDLVPDDLFRWNEYLIENLLKWACI